MKICFIRVSDELIIKNLHPKNIEPDLAIGYCISILNKKGHENFLIDCKAKRYTLEEIEKIIKEYMPTILIISITVPTISVVLKLTKDIKKIKKCLIGVVVGDNTKIIPYLLFSKSPIDIVLIGEIERTVEELVENIEQRKNFKKIKGLVYYDKKIIINKQRKLIMDLDNLPFPSYGHFTYKHYKMNYPIKIHKKAVWGHILTARGCMHRCTFCSMRVSSGKVYRERSAKNIINEIVYLTRNGVNVINFIDDNLTFNRKRVIKLSREIIKRNIKIKWIAQARADDLDEELLKYMKKAGCSTLCIGVESGSNRILSILNKDENKNQILRAFKLCKKFGMLTVAYFIIGNPTETEEEIRESIKFCKELDPDMLQISFLIAYPNNIYYEKLTRKEKRMFSKFSYHNEIVHNFSKIPTNRLKEYQKIFYREFYLRPKFLFRLILERMPYSIFNIKSELELLKETMNFFFKK